MPTSTAVPPSSQPTVEEKPFYLLSEEGEDEGEQGEEVLGSSYAAAPFQLSHALPQIGTAAGRGPTGPLPPLSMQPEQRQKRKRSKLPLLLGVGLATIVVVLVSTVVMTAFAAPTATSQSPATAQTGQATTSTRPVPTTPKAVPTPTTKPKAITAEGEQNGQVTTWASGPLPEGWTNAGLITPDSVEAKDVGITFAEREMTLDFRSDGSRAAHAGTFKAAVFLLTPAAKARFVQNDVRVINNALFERVNQLLLVQVAVDATPKLVKFQAQGNQRFAWIDVAFHLWQSTIDKNGQRHEGLDMDQATKQPRLHHMVVLLLRVDFDDQGPDAPMGGIGWLVSNYALDQPGLPDIVQPA